MESYFSLNIRHLRKLKKFTQSELGNALGVGPTAISKIERGDGYPSVESLLKLVDVFEVNLHDLVFEDLTNGKPPTPRYNAMSHEEVAKLVMRLNLELDRMKDAIIQRADPDDLDELRRFRAELIQRDPVRARQFGIDIDEEGAIDY